MNRHQISIATMTWARDPAEDLLLRESLAGLAELNIPAFITDGGSGEEFMTFLHGFSSFKVFEADTPGLWPQVRRSIQAAHESAAKFILYTEPDKNIFFRHLLPEFITAAPDDDRMGVVLASRSANSFATFPDFQRDTETAINRCCAEVTGASADFSYGPFLLNKDIVPYLDHAPDDLGWGWRPYVFGTARRLGYRIEQVEKDLPCPIEQREDSSAERLYRMSQLSQSVRGLVQSATRELHRLTT